MMEILEMGILMVLGLLIMLMVGCIRGNGKMV
jgi:hypothetical protein